MEPSIRWHVLADAAAVADEGAGRVLAAARRAIDERGLFRIVLAGGRTPQAMHALLSRAAADWRRWHIYFGDERCLPADNPERNSRAAALAWLDRVPIPTANVHAIPAELGAELAAAAYRSVVTPALPFDLVTLGMGEDGHTASLFPGQQHPAGELVHAVHHAPKPPSERVSLSIRALSHAHEILILATGTSKEPAISAWRAGEPLPIAQIGGTGSVQVLLDRDADGTSSNLGQVIQP